jgi:hypothetical protein
VAYAIYDAPAALRRSDVVTREIAAGRDFGAVLADPPTTDASRADRRAALDAVAVLLGALARIGARHPDLNVKNILLAPAGDERGGPLAFVLDVDRVTFAEPGSPAVAAANLERLLRSMRRWRDRRGAPIADDELRRLESAAPHAGVTS